jgi:predicted dehydrogenase
MHLTRRQFVARSAAAASLALTTTAFSADRVIGANDRVRVGLIGFGLIGRIHARAFKSHSDVELVSLSETYRPRLDAGKELIGGRVEGFADFRRLLDDKSIDAVIVATPDHWHALMTMMACAAGKDVYVEKPTTLFVKEGRWMLDVAKRHNRIVQVGTQNRSGPSFARARQLMRDGKLGQLVAVQNSYSRNVMPGFGTPPDSEPPQELDWEMWQGPAVGHKYNPNRAIYHFRWFWDYSGGQMTNLGQHSLDLVHWFMGVKAPTAVYSTGGRRFLKDNGEVPDVQDAILEYPGFTAVCQYRECTAGRGGLGMGGLMFHGTHGTLSVSRTGFELTGDPKVDPANTVAGMLGGHPVGGPQPVPAPKEPQQWTESIKDNSGDAAEDYKRHARNFLDCVKSRQQPVSDLASGHEVATACHLANISLRTGRRIQWDADKEQIVNDPQANAMLERPYRKPWDERLRALLG